MFFSIPAMSEVFHALGLHLHQPLGNLVTLHNSAEPWEAKQILWCYDRITRMLDQYWDVKLCQLVFVLLVVPTSTFPAGIGV
jgi:hypothetical protein